MLSKSEQKPVTLAESPEQDTIDRNMLAWANTYPKIPYGVELIESFMSASAPAMSMQVIQGAMISKKYITGGYEGEYPFSLTYRIKPGGSRDKRVQALELLNDFAGWAETQTPFIGDGLRLIKIEPTTRAVQQAAYNDGDEDYQILMKMTYERT